MAITIKPTPVPAVVPTRVSRGSAFPRFCQTTDHKQIGIMYLVTSFGFFLVGELGVSPSPEIRRLVAPMFAD